jgi:hypothetical protein
MSDLPEQFRTIRLELARDPEHPAGNRGYGYELVIPLDASGRIDRKLSSAHADRCRVRRFRPGDGDVVGRLVRKGSAFVFD